MIPKKERNQIYDSQPAYDAVAKAAGDARRGAGQTLLVRLVCAGCWSRNQARGQLAAGLLHFLQLDRLFRDALTPGQ